MNQFNGQSSGKFLLFVFHLMFTCRLVDGKFEASSRFIRI